MTRLFTFLLACLLTLTACPMNAKTPDPLPRNMSLKAFDPHRPSFECKHELDHVPPIDPEAEAWVQEGLRVTSQDLWPNQRDYPKAVALWTQAAERKHWKAMMNLAGVLIEGDGTEPYVVPPDRERAVRIIEEAMRLGIPAAFDAMGTFHQRGLGVKGDSSRAYAFWELAADMGSPSAQAFLGQALKAAYDNPSSRFWANRKIGLQMLECSLAQGYGKGAYILGSDLKNVDENYSRALVVLHEGVKMGSSDCASSLASNLRSNGPMTAGRSEAARSERYSVFSDALYRNPDLRFPNLDKVLPLPPAELPKWDGNKQTLIDAAKAVVPRPALPPKPAASAASQRTGRAHIPEGWTLPERPQVEVLAQYETTSAPESGYWIARLMRHTEERHIAWDDAQVPMRYARGELFDRTRPGLRPEDGRIQFHYLGERVAQTPSKLLPEDPRVARGIARYGDVPELPLECLGSTPCPKTGVWSASVPAEHPLAAVFNQWHRQTYVMQGQKFPAPKSNHLEVLARDVSWLWLGNANEERAPGLVYIRVDEPTPLAALVNPTAPPSNPPGAT